MGNILSQSLSIAADIEALAADYLKLGQMDATAKSRRLIRAVILGYLGLTLLAGATIQASCGIAVFFLGLRDPHVERVSYFASLWKILLGSSLITGLWAFFCLASIFKWRLKGKSSDL